MDRVAGFTVRDAVPGDASAVARIYRHYVLDTAVSFEIVPPAEEEIAERIRGAQVWHAWLVWEVDSQVVGYAYAHPFSERAAYQWSCEVSIYLDRDHRGSGGGRALYTSLLTTLGARGYRRAFAGITQPNVASNAIHESFGFTQVGTFERVGWKDGTWHDVAWMQRDLPLDGHATGAPTPIRGRTG